MTEAPLNSSELPNSPFRGLGGVVSRSHPLTHYLWGEQCDGWTLVDTPGMSVKMERMPPHTAEQQHFHQFARQFFFILKGRATFYFATESAEDLPADERPPTSALRPADLRPTNNIGEQEDQREQKEQREQEEQREHKEHKVEVNSQEGLE